MYKTLILDTGLCALMNKSIVVSYNKKGEILYEKRSSDSPHQKKIKGPLCKVQYHLVVKKYISYTHLYLYIYHCHSP